MTNSSLMKTFFEKFELFADAPSAVTKMRGMIRTLAVSGQLLRGYEASDWHIVKMKDVCDQITDGEHSTPQRISSGVPLATAKNVRDGFLDLTNTDYVAHSTAEKCWKRCKPQHQDILMVCVGATTGRVCLAQNPPEMVLVRSVALIRPKAEVIEPSYLDLFLRSSLGQEQIWGNVKQSAQPCLYLGKMADFEIPLPPLAEQKRIVAKVDELMALCDRLEAQQQERETRHATLARASLARFADAPTPANLQFLFHPSYAIEPVDLRKSLLLLGFEGKLVPQSEHEGTGAELLLEIGQSHPDGRTFGSRRKGQIELDPFSCRGVFDVPSSWAWTHLDFLCEMIADVDHNMPKAVSEGVPFISAKDLKDDGTIDFSAPKLISEEDFQRLSRKVQIRRDDIIYSRIGARLGKARLVDVDTRFLISYSCCLVRPMHGFVDKRYLQLFLDSTLALNQAHKGAQSIGVPDLGLGEIKAFQVPLPPLAEQRRIVAKIEQLMALVDELETQLTASRATASRLLEAIVAELTGGEKSG